MPDQRVERLARSLSFSSEERSRLATLIYRRKVAVYRDTLRALLREYGSLEEPSLSREVLAGLREEAERHAASIVQTFNRDLRRLLERTSDRPVEEVLDMVEEFAHLRAERRSENIAITEAYGPHADATLAFYKDNGLRPAFDFGGHGDPGPICAICKALKDRNPHPFERVVRIGVPHIACRQSWHPLIARGDLPQFLRAGISLAGIVGSEPLMNRQGNNVTDAAEYIGRMI